MTGIVVVSIASGALAFRPHLNHQLFCNNATSTACNVVVNGEMVSTMGVSITPCAGHPTPTNYETVSTTAACTQSDKVVAVSNDN